MNVQFVSDYIAQCVQGGVNSPDKICEAARQEIAAIDKKLHDADDLRVRKLNLHQVLVHFGNMVKRQASQSINMDLDDDSDEAKNLRVKICEMIEESGALTNREIIQRVGKYQEDGKVIRAIKWLGEREYISRDGSSDNKNKQGPNWDDRPR